MPRQRAERTDAFVTVESASPMIRADAAAGIGPGEIGRPADATAPQSLRSAANRAGFLRLRW